MTEHETPPTDALTWVAVEELRPGDYIDLENDEYADPFGHRGEERSPEDGSSKADHMYYECEYAVAEAVEIETPDCTLVHFEGTASVGFPHGYLLRRHGNRAGVLSHG